MATLTAAYATEKHPWKLAGIASTVAVFWVAHLYAHFERFGRTATLIAVAVDV